MLIAKSCLLLFVGIDPEAITITVLVTTFLGMFQHANIKTPHWLGYIIQRPESHSVHHGKGIHQYNYSDLPIFDILFNTFKNTLDFQTETGFYPGASAQVVKILMFKKIDVESESIDSNFTDISTAKL